MSTVGVIITNHNYGRFLAECLDSVFSQTRAPDEVIVVDDGSSDDSMEILACFGSRVHVIQTAQQGQAAALATGLRASRAEVLALLDSDDTWTVDKLARVLPWFDSLPQVQWLRHQLSVVDERRAVRGAEIPWFTHQGLVPPRPRHVLERTVTVATSALVLRRSAAQRALPLPATGNAGGTVSSFVRDADAALLARLTALGAWGYSLPAVLGQYRRHDGQQFVSRADYLRMIERQISVSESLAELIGEPAGRAIADHKHRLIASTLRGVPIAHSLRVGEMLRGVLAALRALPNDAPLALRQLGGLTFAFAAPRAWLDRLTRQQGLSDRPL